MRYGLVIGITFVTAVAEIIGSGTTDSNSLLSDALHLLGDGIPFVLGFALGIGLMQDEQTKRFVEWMITLLNTIFLVGAALYIGYRGISRLYHPVGIEPVMLWFALAGLAGNTAQLWFARGLKHAHKHAGTYRGLMLHLAADLMASIFVVLAASVIMTTGYVRADSIASLIVAAITAGAAWQCYKELRYGE
ncbi:MAG: cation diffusion facilitator family transporter [Minisyncoccia bacterium]